MSRIGVFLSVFLVSLLARAEDGEIFHDQSFEHFRSGIFNGVSLFASHEGGLRGVNLFDFDGDGWNEILVNNDHNHYETPDAFLYRAGRDGAFRSLYSPLREEMPLYQLLEQTREAAPDLLRLPALGAGRSHVSDLNGDGWPDIAFTNFIHGWSEAPMPTFVYWGDEEGYSISRRSLFDAFRGTAAASADLNGDGRLDLVIANGGREYLINKSATLTPHLETLMDKREKTSYIFMQDETGFSQGRRIELPTLFAIGVKAADVDNDGRPDLIFLEAGKPGRLRVFLNGENGFTSAPLVVPVKAPTWGKLTRELYVGDLDGDGLVDVFAPSEGGTSEIFWNGPAGFSENRKTDVSVENAYSAAAADLDGDGLTDLFVANYSRRNEEIKSTIYDVNSAILQGDGRRFAQGKVTELPTSGATGAEIADVTGDGLPDILVSQHRDKESFDIPSVIYRNSPTGFSAANRDFIGTFGAADVALVPDRSPVGVPSLFFSNRQSGYARYTGTSDAMGGGGEGDSLPHMGIFWGNPAGVFGPGAMTMLPSAAPETTLICTDLNSDGRGDLVYLRGKGDELRVRYSEGQGFSDNIASFPVGFRGKSLLAADFNKDGFVDVVVTALDTPDLAFFAGGKSGFAPARRFPIHGGSQSVASGDFDNDGHLDLIVVGKGYIQVIPGDPVEIFSTDKTSVLPTRMFSSRVCVADLDDDNQLDLFVQNFSDIDATSNAVDSWILYNRGGKFSLDQKRDIPSFGATGGSVADVNRDGRPDLVISNYHGDTTRHVSLFIYYGEKGGGFNLKPVELPAYSSSANLVLDLNNDGYPDIVVFNHSESTEYVGPSAMGGKHGTGSFIYWGSERGFSRDHRSWFPSFGPHARLNADPGDLLSRSSTEIFTSGNKSLTSYQGSARLVVDAATVAPQRISAEIAFDEGEWKELPLQFQKDGTWISDVTIPQARTVRYRLKLDSGNLGNTPVVTSVKLLKQESQ